jgi:Ca-activated chloride channel family protein
MMPSFNNDTIGLAVGGAKDAGNFRENIKQGYLPLPTDITAE